jgi:prolyl-tRNA editing enzyme YbaK/EbsC (Cys-tRNA(Pro) deacylase)
MEEPATLLTSADLQHFIDGHGIEAAILSMSRETPTVSDAASALGVCTDQIIKSLVFLNKDDPFLVITNGLAHVDRRKLATYLDVGRNRIKLSSPETALAISGFRVGSMPPFGHRRKLRTLVDAAVTALDELFGGGGDIDALVRLTPGELLRVTNAEVI